MNFSDFGGVIRLLETQGNVQVISSPRILTLNNQKAIFKVGEEAYYLTNSNTVSFGAGIEQTTNQNSNLEPFFSGIALDVTPQISGEGNIILHIHPILSDVKEDLKIINGQEFPLANSATRESDTIARVRHGEVIVISGLMQTKSSGTKSGVPGMNRIPVLGGALEQKQRETKKTELVILLRALVDQDRVMESMLDESVERVRTMRRVIDPYYQGAQP
jgi:MSHA biogenesis protein MshL